MKTSFIFISILFFVLVLLTIYSTQQVLSLKHGRTNINDDQEDEHEIVDKVARRISASSSSSSGNSEKSEEKNNNNNNKKRNNKRVIFPYSLLDATAKNSFPFSNSAKLFREIDSSFSQNNNKNKNGGEFCFISHGCWGGSHFGKFTHKEIATLISKKRQEFNASFVIAAGDNFYTKGIKSVHDPKFQEVFTNVYIKQEQQQQQQNSETEKTEIEMMKSVPFLVQLGNHDHRGNIAAQINMTWRDPNWFMASNYYSVMLKNIDLAVVALDCPLLERCAVNPSGSPRCLDQFRQKYFLEAALKEISRRKIKFRVVTCHYPLYANGPHVNHQWLRELLDPVMEKYGVSLYINADNHYLQVSERKYHSSNSCENNNKNNENEKESSSRRKSSIFYVNSGGGGGYKLHKKSDKGYKVNRFNVFEHLGNGIFVHCIDKNHNYIHNIAFDNKGKELFSFDAYPSSNDDDSSCKKKKSATNNLLKKQTSNDNNNNNNNNDEVSQNSNNNNNWNHDGQLLVYSDALSMFVLASACILIIVFFVLRKGRKGILSKIFSWK